MPKGDELVLSTSPHIHATEDVRSIMLKVLIALTPVICAGIILFGNAAALIMAYCVVFCVAAEAIWLKLAGKSLSTLKDLSAIVTGILLAMNLSAGAPWWLCLIGSVLAIWLAKQIFGGLGHNPFNPAAVARVGLLIALPKYMTTWIPTRFMNYTTADYCQNLFTKTDWQNVVMGKIDAVTCATPLGVVGTTTKVLTHNPEAVNNFAQVANPSCYWQYFLGNMGGCLGETSALALLIGGLILIAFKLIKWQVPVFYLGSVAIITGVIHFFLPGVTPPPLFHLLTGGLMIGAIFMATDMVTSPMTTMGAAIFGVGLGIVTCTIRIWGNYPEGVSFAIVFMNALVPLIDKFVIKRPFGYNKPIVEEGVAA
ncbi:MAG: RnfABCDGE type electron transport complex subunit D [Lentisphaerae bacterium]|nr:RnfABCDGE type electron transport complex subunit D [Lentisphaerota bacterium]MCP4102847.1 RnfABCDGE type electron transport complex subunit D [Lentisphaerota bacterium]